MSPRSEVLIGGKARKQRVKAVIRDSDVAVPSATPIKALEASRILRFDLRSRGFSGGVTGYAR